MKGVLLIRCDELSSPNDAVLVSRCDRRLTVIRNTSVALGLSFRTGGGFYAHRPVSVPILLSVRCTRGI